VEFEPSPIYRKRPRGRLEGFSTLEVPLPSVQLEEIQDEEIAPLPEAEKKKREEVAGKQPGGRGFFPPAIVYIGSPLGGDGLVFLLFMGLFGLTMWAVWTTSYALLPSPEAAYLKLKRLAVFLGLKVPLSLTPNEFSRALTRIVPTAREDISLICDSFVMSTYGKKRLSIRQKVGLLKAWRNARRKLVLQLVNEQQAGP
jgi:hypothetical protein